MHKGPGGTFSPVCSPIGPHMGGWALRQRLASPSPHRVEHGFILSPGLACCLLLLAPLGTLGPSCL